MTDIEMVLLPVLISLSILGNGVVAGMLIWSLLEAYHNWADKRKSDRFWKKEMARRDADPMYKNGVLQLGISGVPGDPMFDAQQMLKRTLNDIRRKPSKFPAADYCAANIAAIGGKWTPDPKPDADPVPPPDPPRSPLSGYQRGPV